MPEEQKTAETEQERLADFPRDLSRSFTYLHRQRKKYMDDRLRGYGFVGGMPMILLYINRHPGTTQDAIVSHMYIDKCTVARRTNALKSSATFRAKPARKIAAKTTSTSQKAAKISCPSSARFCRIGPKASRATFPMKSAFYSSHC